MSKCQIMVEEKSIRVHFVLRDGPLESDGGRGREKKPKKIPARENAKKKNSCKEEGKEKKFMQKEGPIVIFI